MVEGVFSFNDRREACLADEAEGWRQCVRQYAALVRQLLKHYFPGFEQSALLTQVFRQARANQAQLWRSFTGTDEKEFLLHLRQFVLGQGRAARGAPPDTPLTLENFWALLQEFPPLQREMLILSFRGYPLEALNLILKFEVATGQAVVAQAREKLAARLGQALPPDFHARDHDGLFAAIEQQRSEKCLPDRIYARITDGQITWRDREEAERHLGECLYCVNRFADFREVSYFFRTLPPAEESTVEAVVAAMELPSRPTARKKVWWLRLLGG